MKKGNNKKNAPLKKVKQPNLDRLMGRYSDVKLNSIPGLDAAIIGTAEDFNSPVRIVYSVKKSIEILASQMTVRKKELEQGETMEQKKYDLASEFFHFNYAGAYLGEKTPVWCHDDFAE